MRRPPFYFALQLVLALTLAATFIHSVAQAPSAPKPGETLEIPLSGGEKMIFRWCPAGSFTMGSPASEKDRQANEQQVSVRLTQGFWMAQTETTQGQWQALMGGGTVLARSADLPGPAHWAQAHTFISKLNASTRLPPGLKVTLPSEAQWEYACRAGTQTAFCVWRFAVERAGELRWRLSLRHRQGGREFRQDGECGGVPPECLGSA